MSVQKIKQWYLGSSNSFNLINNSIFLLLPLTLLVTTISKTLASEEVIIPKELNSLDDADEMSQITNVKQLRDVSPTDWAYEALRSLVDRYGCIAGFPNQTYRGSQPLSRYEFAAGLNSCLNQIERLVAASESVSQPDLETVQRLSQEFEGELATLAGRVDSLESQVAVLEDNQFSTTTKFTGNIFLNATGATASDDVLAETASLDPPLNLRRAGRDGNNNPLISNISEDPEITFSYYSWLNFNSSFTGEDNL
ncbi:MAG: iron uptake porin, partial [Waterburya sp.]